MRRTKAWAILAVSLMVAPAYLGWSATPTSADCTLTNGNFYAAGGFSSTTPKDGVRGDIQWVKGAMCTSGVSHSVTLMSGGQWVQVGWRYYAGYTNPMMYCEVNDPWEIVEFSLTSATHAYRFQHDAADKTWDCYLDSSAKWSKSSVTLGFDSRTSVNGQGEAHQDHVQIGKVAPSKLLFSDLQWRRKSDAAWPVMNVVLNTPPPPYGNDEPVVGQMRVWTNAH